MQLPLSVCSSRGRADFAYLPFFAKTWRIYKIFMRTKMQVVKITNTMLFMRIGLFLGIDAVRGASARLLPSLHAWDSPLVYDLQAMLAVVQGVSPVVEIHAYARSHRSRARSRVQS